jgi:hypothetical protein
VLKAFDSFEKIEIQDIFNFEKIYFSKTQKIGSELRYGWQKLFVVTKSNFFPLPGFSEFFKSQNPSRPD